MAISIEAGRLGVALCQAVGIDHSNVKRLEIDIQAGSIATIKATSFIIDDQVKEIVRVFRMAEWREEVI